MSTSMQLNLPEIYLRYDQKSSDMNNKQNCDQNVVIFAPEWMRTALDHFSSVIPKNTKYKIIDRRGESMIKEIESELTLKDLIMFARNEPANITGAIDFSLYSPLITEKSLIYSLKDLVRQCITIGKDMTTHYGGYPSGNPIPQEKEVILIDSIGLQFQKSYNSGRLVLINKHDYSIEGALDDLIFQNVVGEPKRLIEEIVLDQTGRYVKINDQYFDTFAYQMFVANDVLLVCLALNKMKIPDINFKFLKYGTGSFAGSYLYRMILEKHIGRGVYRGLRALFDSGSNKIIKMCEFPFYKEDPDIIKLCKENGVECRFSKDDCLKQTHPSLMTATTNCGEPHTVMGNEMGYSSVDGAIAHNLMSKANKFSPILNSKISEQFIKLPPIIKSRK